MWHVCHACSGLPASVARALPAGSQGCLGLVAPLRASCDPPALTRSWLQGSGSLLPKGKQSGIGFLSTALSLLSDAGLVSVAQGAAWRGGLCSPVPCRPVGTLAPESFEWPWEERSIPASSPHTLLFRQGCVCFRVMKSIIMQPIFLDEASCLHVDSCAYKYCEFPHGFISLASNSTITANLLDFQSSKNIFPGARCLAKKVFPKNSKSYCSLSPHLQMYAPILQAARRAE